jgi:hypothetical protein
MFFDWTYLRNLECEKGDEHQILLCNVKITSICAHWGSIYLTIYTLYESIPGTVNHAARIALRISFLCSYLSLHLLLMFKFMVIET